MTLAGISLAYLRARPLATALNLLLLALGIATITVLLLATSQLEDRMSRDARGIDLVAGAKGSPMQLVLAAVFHIDAPAGNIPLAEALALAKNRAVKKAIPLALGDSFRGYRIVGTNHDYPAHYGATLGQGRLWAEPMEAVLGAEVAAAAKLAVGASFAGAHGLGEGGDVHEAEAYKVTGVLAATGTVLDRLVLTSVESVWEVHEHAGQPAGGKEITALLIQYATPLAAAMLPRQVNASPSNQPSLASQDQPVTAACFACPSARPSISVNKCPSAMPATPPASASAAPSSSIRPINWPRPAPSMRITARS